MTEAHAAQTIKKPHVLRCTTLLPITMTLAPCVFRYKRGARCMGIPLGRTCRRLHALDRLFHGHYACLIGRETVRLFLYRPPGLPLSQAVFFLGRRVRMMTMLFGVGVLVIVPRSQSRVSQSKKGTEQVALEGSLDLDTSADRALLFFTPEGERAWVKDWNPKPVYPPQASVAFQANAVFRVDQ